MSPPDYSGLPYEVITEVNENDIVCGRKGLALKHSGNMSYRKIVALNKEGYGKFEDETYTNGEKRVCIVLFAI